IVAGDESTVHGDRDLLFEAVANLVDNALKFTPAGGRVELALLRREGETVIRVSDTGPGIPEDERGAVTKRFYRSDKSRCTEGLGLGLSLVPAIVNLHGFRLTIGGSPGATAEIICPPIHKPIKCVKESPHPLVPADAGIQTLPNRTDIQ